MSHPIDRRERFLIGFYHGIRRIKGENGRFGCTREHFEEWSRKRRNTTKLCSCAMCGNPRRKAWKKKDQITFQEIRFFESCKCE
jgi:hypothetical protein